MSERTLFIAGSTGAVGRTVVRLAGDRGTRFIPHRRPSKTQPAMSARMTLDPRAAVFALDDATTLAATLAQATTVVQLVGTMRKRFAAGDTYETSDIGTTRALAAAAKAAGTIDHFVLLSSVGAGSPVGAYLKAKAEAERIVRESGIPWTVFRPSTFVGEGHKPPLAMGAITRLFGMAKYKPIAVEDLARAILRVAEERAPLGAILEGKSLWQVVGASAEPAGDRT